MGALLAIGARLLPGIGRIMGGAMKSGMAQNIASKLAPGMIASDALHGVKDVATGGGPQAGQPVPGNPNEVTTPLPGPFKTLPIPAAGPTYGATDFPSSQGIVPDRDSEDGDTKERDDGERDRDLQVGPGVNEVGGTDEGPDHDFDPAGEGAQHFESLLPKLLELLLSDQSGADDPEIQDLHNKLEAEIPGYLDHAGDDDDGAQMITLLMGGGHDQASDPALKDNDAPHDPISDPDEDGALRESRFAEHLTALPGVHPFVPLMGDPSDAHPHAIQGKCPMCGSTLDPTSALCPQCGQGNATTRMSADTQGPNTDEQKAAVAELLTSQGRQDEVPGMIMEPWKYGDELSQIIGSDDPPDPTTDDPMGQQQPPAGPPEGAAPTMGMPPPGAGGAPQQMMGAVRHYTNQVDSLAESCPNCGSHSTGYLDDDGNCACKTCHHEWKVDGGLADENSRTAAPHGDAQNVQGAPAADQQGQDDPEQNHDPSHTWHDTNGDPLRINAEYKMYSNKYDIPDIIRITDVKSEAFEYTNVGEFGLGHSAEVPYEEAQLEDLQFEPFQGDGPEGFDDPGSQENMEDIGRPAAGQDQTDLSTPHMQMAKVGFDDHDPYNAGPNFDQPYGGPLHPNQGRVCDCGAPLGPNGECTDPEGHAEYQYFDQQARRDEIMGLQDDNPYEHGMGGGDPDDHYGKTAMTAKDFRLLAEAIKNSPVENQEELAHHFADHLQMTNPAFDRDRFVGAATGEPLSGRDKYNPENPREHGGVRPEPPPPPPPPPDPLEEQYAQPSAETGPRYGEPDPLEDQWKMPPFEGKQASPEYINLEPDWENFRNYVLNIAKTDLQQAVRVNNELAGEAIDVNTLAQAAGVSPQEVEAMSGGMNEIADITGPEEGRHPLGPHTGSPEGFPVDQSLSNGVHELPATQNGRGVGQSYDPLPPRSSCPQCGVRGASAFDPCPNCGHDPSSEVRQSAEDHGPDWLASEIQKEGGARFTPMEQQGFIEEKGEARNMDKLDIAGTHYEAATELEEMFPFGGL